MILVKLGIVIVAIPILWIGFVVIRTWITGELGARCPKCGKISGFVKHVYEPPPPHNWIEKSR